MSGPDDRCRRRGLGRLRIAALLLSCAGAVPTASANFPIRAGSPADQELMQTDIGSDPVRAMQWLPLLQEAGRSEQADHLRRYLVARYLAVGLGGAAAEAPSLRDALSQGSELPSLESSQSAREQLGEFLTRHLRLQWATELQPLPARWKSDAAGMTQVMPGLWTLEWPGDRDVSRPMSLVLDVVNRGTLPVVVGGLSLTAAVDGGTWPRFDCQAVASADAPVLAPGMVMRLECRGGRADRVGTPGEKAVMRAFSVRSKADVKVIMHGGLHSLTFPAMTRALAALTRNGEASEFRKRNAGCRPRDSCTAVTQASPPPPPARPKASPVARNWLVLATAFWLFCGLAQWVGSRAAAVTMALVIGPALVLGLGGVLQQLPRGSSVDDRIGTIALVLFGLSLIGGSAIAAVGMAWLYERLFGERGGLRWVYRQLNGKRIRT